MRVPSGALRHKGVFVVPQFEHTLPDVAFLSSSGLGVPSDCSGELDSCFMGASATSGCGDTGPARDGARGLGSRGAGSLGSETDM